jgi:GT2 family glycosyltransferase
MSVVSIIFSYNRAFQLDATLRSLMFHCEDIEESYVKIIYKADGIHKEQYLSLIHEYEKFTNIQFVEEKKFKADLISLVAPFDYVLFLVDDNIFVDKFKFSDGLHLLKSDKSVIAVSLRLGLNTTYCYSLNCEQEIPSYQMINDMFMKFNWLNSQADFAYPLELSSSIYRSNDLLNLLSQIPFENPNTLEANLDAKKQLLAENYPNLVSYKFSKTFCAPINKVQTVAASNRAGTYVEYSAEDLAKKYGEGLRFDISAFIGYKPNACHQEVDLTYVNENISKTSTKKIVRSGPLVSIVIPCYKQAELVTDALESVVKQTYQKWECIVVNDGSPDNTSKVVRQFRANYPDKEIKLLEVKNGGLSSARNRGIECSTGIYILPFDSDDRLHEDYLKRMVEELEKNPEISFVYCNRQDFGISNDAVSAVPFDFNQLIHGNILSYCSMYRRSVWEDANGYDESLTSYEDWNFWISAAKCGHIGLFVPEFLFYYRVKEQSMYTEALERDPLLKSQIIQNHPELYSREIVEKAKTIYQAKSPLVSVIMPTYNRPIMLKEAIESIIAQDYKNIELIVINDNGCDVDHIIKGFEDKIKIKYRENTRNLKLAASRNVGLNIASGKYITYLDDDDIFYPDHISTLVSFLEKSRYKIAYTDGNKAIQKKLSNDSYQIIERVNELSNDFSKGYLLINNITPVCCVMHAKECSDVIGKFDERLHTLEDWDFWIRMSYHYDFKHIKKITCEYRQRLDGSNSTFQDQTYFRHSERIILLNNLELLRDKEQYLTYALERIKLLNQHLSYDSIGNPQISQRNQSTNFDKTISVSVILPTFNRPDLIKRTLNSLVNQTFRDFEVIVVNDAGENIEKLLNEFNHLLNIRYFQNSKNLGLAATRNIGLKNAEGKYIAYLDDDDIYYPEHLETLVKEIENSDYKVVYTDSIRVIEEFVNGEYIEKERYLDQSTDFYRDILYCRNITPVLAVMHEKECIQKVGYFREDFFAHEDWEYWIRMAESYDFLHIPKVTSEFFQRVHNDNMTSTKQAEFNRTRIEIYNSYKDRVADKKEYANFIQNELEKLDQITTNQDGVSIIILTYKTRDLTKKCIDSILLNTKENYEIILVDNASEDGSLDLAREYDRTHNHIRLVENDTNYGFSKGNNIGVKFAKYNKLLFLNNDVEVINSNWLSSLKNLVNHDPKIAIVGSKLLFPNKLIQHAGVVVVNDESLDISISCCHRYYKTKDNNELLAYECQAVTGACLLIRKELFQKVSGFDEAYWNGYEDMDLCFKIRELGYKVVYEPKSVLIHHESMSGKERDIKTNENLNRLLKTWSGKIRPDAVTSRNKQTTIQENSVFREYKKELTKTGSKASKRGSVTVVIVTYFSENTILKCLNSVEESMFDVDQVVVVDNASTDGTTKLIHEFIEAKVNYSLIENKENLGFSEACNQAILSTNSDYVVLLNPDTIVTKEWLNQLSFPMERDAKIAAVGPLSNFSCGEQYLFHHLDEDLIKKFNNIEDISAFLTDKFSNEVIESSFLVGFCMMIRRSHLEDVGFLDKKLFLGSDDIDLSWRFRLAGYHLVVNKSAYIYHEGQHSFKQAGKDFTERLTDLSTEELYKKLKRFYGECGVPNPMNLWGMDWFKPENAEFNPNASIEQMENENKLFLKQYHRIQYLEKNDAKLSILNFLEEHSNNALALEELAILTWNEAQYDEALKLIEASIIQNPENESAFVEFIDMLLSLNLNDEAYKFLTDYLDKKPKHEDSLIRLHNIYVDKNDLSAAKNTIRQLVKLNPQKPEYQTMLESIR